MGGTSGKLYVDQSDGRANPRALRKAVQSVQQFPEREAPSLPTVDHEKIARTQKAPHQLVNGETNAMNDIPSIDEVSDEHEAKRLSHSNPVTYDEDSVHSPNPNVDQANGLNGKLGRPKSAAPDESKKKKGKNYMNWIKRHMSLDSQKKYAKRGSDELPSNPPKSTTVAVEESNQSGDAAVEECPVAAHEGRTFVADAVVEETVESIMSDEYEPASHFQLSEPAPERATEHILEKPEVLDHEPVVQNTEDESISPLREESYSRLTEEPMTSAHTGKQQLEPDVSPCSIGSSECSGSADKSEICEIEEPPPEPVGTGSNSPTYPEPLANEMDVEQENNEVELEFPVFDTNNTNVNDIRDSSSFDLPSPVPDTAMSQKCSNIKVTLNDQELGGTEVAGSPGTNGHDGELNEY